MYRENVSVRFFVFGLAADARLVFDGRLPDAFFAGILIYYNLCVNPGFYSKKFKKVSLCCNLIG